MLSPLRSTAGSRKLEYGCRISHAGVPSFFGLGLADSGIRTFWLLLWGHRHINQESPGNCLSGGARALNTDTSVRLLLPQCRPARSSRCNCADFACVASTAEGCQVSSASPHQTVRVAQSTGRCQGHPVVRKAP